MALFDLQPVDLSIGERILPNARIKVKIVSDKQLPASQTSAESEAHFRQAFKTTHIVMEPAEYKEVTHDLEYRNCSLPGPFIKVTVKTPEQIEQTLEYDIDEEDRVWLEEENKKRELKKKKKIKDDMFELAIDRLEKETYFKNAPHENDASSMDDSEHLDDDCCICGNGDVDNVNQIIYCDMCNIAVHQDCYGVPYIPEGQWLCRKCKLSPMESVKCELCPLREGAFKQTADGKWAHVACAIWLNEVHFGNTAFLEPIEGVQNSLRRRQKLKCLVCKVKGGACLQCSKGSCVKSFHVTCAMQARLQMVVDAVEDTTSPDGLTVKRFVYCHVHGSVAVGDNEFAKNKKRAIEAIHRARRRMLNNACSVSTAAVPTVDAEAKKRIEAVVGDKGAVEDIMGFWFYKRKKRFGLPLIRRLQVKKKVVARVPTLRGEAARKGRIVYEKARLLVELMHKREKNYLETIMLEKKMVPALLKPIEDVLVDFINSLIPIDDFKFFREDPLKQGLLHYSTIVKKPMDLGTMRRNAQKGVYKNEAEMKEHLDLIFKNCTLFNKSNDGVLEYARDRQQKMNQAYADLVDYLKYMRSWVDGVATSSNGEPEKKKIKEETKETQKELRDAPTPREELNKRKRKAESPKREDLPETPTAKKEKRTRDRDKEKETPKPAATCSIFSSALTPRSPTSVRRFSLDAALPRLDSNCNKPQRRMPTRGTTQSSFNLYRDMSSVLSPEMGVSSCDSAVESDMETARPSSRSYSRSSLSDINSLHHGDLVKVNGKTGCVVGLAEGAIEDPKLYQVYDALQPNGPNDILVRHFTKEPKGGEYARYDSSCVALLNINTDKVEGIREAREYQNRMICSK